jgi:Phage tail tube protein, GTA-gp10
MGAGHAVVNATWADGDHTFRLEWKHWLELQEKLECGPNELLERLMLRRWRVQDLAEIIRLGLIGGGKSPTDAIAFVRRYVHDRPILENVEIATRIVSASLIGPMTDDDAPGEPPVATENVNTEELISESSTETEQLPGSPPKM